MSNNSTCDVIIAQCTPRGSGALAVVRLSGECSVALADAISVLPNKKKLSDQTTHTIHYGWVIDGDNNHIDQVLFALMRAPQTFTGEDTVEITSHNNPFIIEAIIQQAVAHGARIAEPGEFTRRAFLNKKIDLIQAESINELIHAQTQKSLQQSLAQLKGSLSQWITQLEKELITTLAWSEASFEFLDDAGDFKEQIHQRLTSTRTTIATIKKSYPLQNQIRQGIRIALVGSVNAGKSSLFNALIGQQRAIVTPIAGTTRDSIEAGLYKNGNYWTLIDTAGLRKTDDVIEQLGIERSKEEAKKADIVLVVFDVSTELSPEESSAYDQIIQEFGHKSILVYNKIDLQTTEPFASLDTPLRGTRDERNPVIATESSLINPTPTPFVPSVHVSECIEGCERITVSGLTGKNCDLLEEAIQGKILELFKSIDSPYLLNQRHYHLLSSLEQKLEIIVEMVQSHQVHYELVSHHLQDALENVCELTGKSVSEAGLDAVFKEFCVGK